ncbi:MAG: hypothetical protein HKM04_09060 [Legionellales bacterium]|nr:hypothetical protein [Legionellales bacterium]
MWQLQDKLQYIAKEIEDLVGAVAFGGSRLQEFHDLLGVLDADISRIMHHRHYKLCADEHRRIMTMLMTTMQSLTDWRILALEYLEALDDLVLRQDNSMLIGAQEAKVQCNKLISELHVHRQEIEKMDTRMTNLTHRLVQKKLILSSLEINLSD